jgi:Tol biopolymer transport system component
MLVAALAVPLLAAMTSEASPASRAAAEPTLLAYQALTGGIFTIQPSGLGNREVIPGAYGAVWSPDGRRLLYTGQDGALWVSRPDGSGGRSLVRPGNRCSGTHDPAHTAGDPAWSRWGRLIAFVATSDDEEEREVDAICTVSSDGSRVRELRAGREPEWLPGGKRIAFTLGPRSDADFRSNRIASMRRDGRGFHLLVGDAKGYRQDLRVSPDGRRMLFREQLAQPGYAPAGLRVMNLRTGRIRAISAGTTGNVVAATWTPGGRIAFMPAPLPLGGRAAPSSIYAVRHTGKSRRRLFTLPFEEQRGLWADTLSWQPSTGSECC